MSKGASNEYPPLNADVYYIVEKKTMGTDLGLDDVAAQSPNAVDECVAQDLSDRLNWAANMIDELRDFAMWMTGCGYDFCQHEYFIKKRDELLVP